MSRIPGFYKLSRAERRQALERVTGRPLSDIEASALVDGVDHDLLDGFVENVVGAFPLPLGVAAPPWGRSRRTSPTPWAPRRCPSGSCPPGAAPA